MRVLVAGGAGYIGTHTCIALMEAGYEVVVADNFCNSKRKALLRLEELAGKKIPFRYCDMTDERAVDQLFWLHRVEAVIHFAGLKAVEESVKLPLRYYYNNVVSTINLCKAMRNHGVHKIVFSSSATVYGENEIPFVETMPLMPAANPYGETKVMSERILQDVSKAEPDWSVAILRYFNPIGAHPSGRIGEDPQGIPNNLMPYITQVASGRRAELRIWGDDYPTVDGTGVRDYIHVVDLAKGHLAAADYASEHTGCEAINLGSGRGHSVLELVHTFEEVNGVPIPYEVTPRRPGDIATSYADAGKAARLLHWRTERTLADMCRDAWNWERKSRE